MCDVRISGKKCRRTDGGVVFYEKDICDVCWTRHCEGKIDLKKLFKIKDGAQEPKEEGVSKQTHLAYNGVGIGK